MNTCTPRYLETTTIPYEDNQPVELNSWDGEAYPLSIFRTIEFLDTDSKNILTSLLQMANFIRNRKLKNNTENDIPALEGFCQAAWSFISSIYEAGWDSLKTDNCNRTFRQNVASKFTPKTTNNKPNKRVDSTIKEKQVEVVKIPPIPPRLSKETLEKLKFFKKKYTKSKENANLKDRWSYAQASAPKIKLKENFPNLSAKKIKNIHNTINSSGKVKFRINITTKGPSRRQIIRSQIIIPMSNDNKLKFMISSNLHITNLNRALKNIKSNIIADFV